MVAKILTEKFLISGGSKEVHDEHPGTHVLPHLGGDVHPVLADMARGGLPRQAHASQHLLPHRRQRLEEHTGKKKPKIVPINHSIFFGPR